MLDEYLSKIPLIYRNIINDRILNDNKFNFFINNCAKINLDIFNDDKIINKNNLLLKLDNIKLGLMKNFGIKIFKQYSEDLDNGMNKINTHYKKIISKIEIIDNNIMYINNFDDNGYINLYNKSKISNKIKIEYSEDVYNTNDVIDFNPSLFVTSDDYDSEKQFKSLKCNLKNKDPFLAEYSN